MMSVLKKLAAGALAALTLVSFTACGADTSIAMTVGGTSVRAGVYIQQLLASAYEASSKISEQTTDTENTEETDLWKQSIDGVSTSEWIKTNAEKLTRSFVAVEHKCAELGVELDSTAKKIIETNVSQTWEQNGTYYEELGVSKQSYEDVLTNSKKTSLLFEKYYGEGGIEAVSDTDLKAYFEDNYMRVKYIAMPVKDGEGNLLKSDGKKELRKLADEYASRASAENADFDALLDKYTEYRAKQVADATGSSSSSSSSTSSAADEEKDPYANESLVQKDSTYPTKNFVEKLFAGAKENTPLVIEDDEYYYVALRLPLSERTELFEDKRATILSALKSEEFTAMIESWGAALTVEKNEDAIKRYDPEKLLK